MSIKLDSLAQITQTEDEGQWVDIKHPAGGALYLGGQTKKPFRVRVAGSYSKTAREAQRRNREDSLKRRGRSDLEDIERRELSVLAACTLEWDGAFDDEGKEIPLTKANALAVYSAEGAQFIADQVDMAGGDHARFFEPR